MSLSKKDYEITLNWYDNQVAQAVENRKRFITDNQEHHMIPGETKETYQARLALGYPK